MTDALPIIPVVTLGAALVVLLFITVFGVKRRVLSQRTGLILLLTIGAVLAATATLTVRALRKPDGAGTAAKEAEKLEVAVEFSLTQVDTEVVHVPFRAGSGSVNLGCEEQRSVPVEFQLPAGAEETTASAEWVNVDNIESRDASVNVEPGRVIAIGTIRGLHRTFLFNCPGGGHGELVLHGEYVLRHVLPARSTTIKSIRDIAHRGQVFTATLPPITSAGILNCKVTISDSHGASVLTGAITTGQKGDLELKVISRTGALPTDIKIAGQTLVMTI